MHDGCAHLALHVVANDRQSTRGEAFAPLRIGGDEHGDAIDERAAGLERLLRIMLRRLLGAHGQIAHDDVGLRRAEDARYGRGRFGRFRDLLAQITANAVERGTALNDHAGGRDGRKALRVVRRRKNGVRHVAAHLAGRHVERARDLDVADRISANVCARQSGRGFVALGVAIVRQSLHEGRGAIADAHETDAHLSGPGGGSTHAILPSTTRDVARSRRRRRKRRRASFVPVGLASAHGAMRWRSRCRSI